MKPGEEDIDESIMEVEGTRFREPTRTEAEHNAQHHDRPKKRNYDEQFDRAPFTEESSSTANNTQQQPSQTLNIYIKMVLA